MAELQQHQRRRERARLIEDAARTNVPSEVNRIDGEIVTDLLSTIGWIDIDFHPGVIFNFKHLTKYKTNKDGRIVQLALGQGPYTTRGPDGNNVWITPQPEFSKISWILPDLISGLTMLKELILWKCQSLPDILHLPKLRLLVLQDCDDETIMSINETSSIKLPVLDKLILREFCITSTNTSSVITFLKQLPSLDRLEYIDDVKEDNCRRSCNPFLQLLTNGDCCDFLMDQLVNIGMYNFIMTPDDVMFIFNKLLISYPNVTGISIQNNLIETFEGVAENLNVNRKLIKILIDGNPVTDKLVNNDENEKEALLRILSKYNRVSCIGCEVIDGAWRHINLDRYGPDIDYALRINHAGRTLIENIPLPAVTTITTAAARRRNGNNDSSGTQDHDDDDDDDDRENKIRIHDGSTSIPLSVWPIVLERATQPRSLRLRGLNQHTGLFYLVRNNVPFFENLTTKNLKNEEGDCTDTFI